MGKLSSSHTQDQRNPNTSQQETNATIRFTTNRDQALSSPKPASVVDAAKDLRVRNVINLATYDAINAAQATKAHR